MPNRTTKTIKTVTKRTIIISSITTGIAKTMNNIKTIHMITTKTRGPMLTKNSIKFYPITECFKSFKNR